jgi:hypothetical protein
MPALAVILVMLAFPPWTHMYRPSRGAMQGPFPGSLSSIFHPPEYPNWAHGIARHPSQWATTLDGGRLGLEVLLVIGLAAFIALALLQLPPKPAGRVLDL